MVGELVDTMANLEYGILIAIILVVLLMLGIATINNHKSFTPISYIIAVVLLIPLTFQMSRLIGACYISDTASSINNLIGAVSSTLGSYVQSYTTRDIGWFIFRRVLWALLFMGIGGVGIYVTMNVESGRRYHSEQHIDKERRPLREEYHSHRSIR